MTDTPTEGKFNKTALSTALALTMCTAAPSYADQVSGTYTGIFTLVTPTNAANFNADSGGFRTPVSGTFSYDIATGAGSMTITPFSFFGSGAATASAVSFQNIGDGGGIHGSATLFGAEMSFNWNGNFNIPVTDVFDATGFLNLLGSITPSAIIGGTPATVDNGNCGALGCVTSQSPDSPLATSVGAVPLAMTTFNTSGTTLGSLFPLSTDGVAGSPMTTAPFPGQNAAFDFQSMTVDTYVDTTAPAMTLNGSANINLNVGDPYTELGANCTDNVDGNIDGSVIVSGDTVNTGVAGTYTVLYDCADAAANNAPQLSRTVNVTASGTPAISLLGTSPVTHEAATTYNDAGATCNDPDDGNIAPLNGTFTPPQDFSSVSTVNENVPGSYSVSYDCTDSAGNAAPQTVRNVDVVDTTPPTLTLTPACSAGAGAISQVADGTDPTPIPTSIDTVDGDISAGVIESGGPVDPSPAFGSNTSQTFNLGFSSTDSAGNTSLTSCDVVLGNPDPVATLNGNATVVLGSGVGFNDPLANCVDFVDGALPDAVADMVIDDTTPNGNYTITYTCTNSAVNTGTTTRTVVVGSSFSAASDSGSNFTMINPSGDFVGGATDIFASWDGSLYTVDDPANQQANLFMNSAEPQPFFGFPWDAHDIRAFGPGSYSIATSRGNTLDMVVGENQIGAHMLFDWNGNNDIDVVLVWDINAVFAGAPGVGDNGAKGKAFTFAVVDSDGDGIPGIPMADGPFEGFNANFNLKLTPQFGLPDVSTTAVQGTNNPASVIAPTAPSVTITATVDPNISGASSYTGPFSYDWSGSDAALLAVDDDNTTSATYTFDPISLAEGPVTARVKVTDGPTGLTSSVEVALRVAPGGATVGDVTDTDGDGIIDLNDGIDNMTNPNLQQVSAGSVVTPTEVAASSAGTLSLGELATQVGASTGNYQLGVSDTDIGVVDNDVDGSCIGGCFSFEVSGLVAGSAVDITLPLSSPIPANAGVRKLVNNQWRDFETGDGNAIMSAPLSAGQDCAQLAASAFRSGPVEGDECLKLTIVDGGVNDADGLANGTVTDPSGVSGASTSTPAIPPSVQSPNTGGGCTMAASNSRRLFSEWLLIIGGLLGWAGLSKYKRRNSTQ